MQKSLGVYAYKFLIYIGLGFSYLAQYLMLNKAFLDEPSSACQNGIEDVKQSENRLAGYFVTSCQRALLPVFEESNCCCSLMQVTNLPCSCRSLNVLFLKSVLTFTN